MTRSIALVVPRGDAVRSFLQTGVLSTLAASGARLTVLTPVPSDEVRQVVSAADAELVTIEVPAFTKRLNLIRQTSELAHYRMLWSQVARNMWEKRDATEHRVARVRWLLRKARSRALAYPLVLDRMDQVERRLMADEPAVREAERILQGIGPDLVFNCSHVHGSAGVPFVFAAAQLGIATGGYVFSWDNVTSRGRIHEPYDDLLVWTPWIKQNVLDLYTQWTPQNVHVVGTPQFDPHFDESLVWSREQLCERFGLDPTRPFIFYTAGISRHFPEEHRTVELLADLLDRLPRRPQLLVRVNVKEVSDGMLALASQQRADVVFPEVSWDRSTSSATPKLADLYEYTNLVRHADVGVNAASTVSLELMLHDRPIVNLGFDPPGASIPHHLRWERHLEFDHYRPIAESGAVHVAMLPDDLEPMLREALENPEAKSSLRRAFIEKFFGREPAPVSGEVAALLLQLAEQASDATPVQAHTR